MSKKIIFILLLTVLSVGVAYYLILTKEKSFKNSFFVVERKNLIKEINLVGKIKPKEKICLAFEKTGVLSNVFVKEGETVKRGAILAQLDINDVQKRVKEAEINLENAKIALDKLNLEREKLFRGDVLNKNYEDGISVLSFFYDKTAVIFDSLENILFGNELSDEKKNISYYAHYDKNFEKNLKLLLELYEETERVYSYSLLDYQLAQRGEGEARNKAIRSGYDLALKLAEIIKLARDIIRNLQDLIVKENLIHTKESILNNHSKFLSEYDTIINDCLKKLINIVNATNEYKDRLEFLPLEIKTQNLIIQQKENELAEAKNNLAKHFLYSPIDGIVSRLEFKKGEIVTANQPIIEIISESDFEIVADVYEEDIVNIERGMPVKISLPAFSGKIFQGKVIFIEPAEKIIDGVVYYEIKIVFNEEPPEKIKSNMTTDIVIQTEKKENVLVVPREAIKMVGEKTVVGVLVDNLIYEKEVEIGLKSDTLVEIISGLKEGEKVMLR